MFIIMALGGVEFTQPNQFDDRVKKRFALFSLKYRPFKNICILLMTKYFILVHPFTTL